MIIRMTHPQHGEMDVYTDAEVAANAKNGWSVVEMETAKSVITVEKINSLVAEVVTEMRPAKSLAEQYEAKFGKKPHWKMKPETIEAALKD